MGSNSARGNRVSLRKMIVYYRIGSERQLNEDKSFLVTSTDQTHWMTLMRE